MRREVGQPLHGQNFRQHGVDREAMGSDSDTLKVSFRQTTHRVGNSFKKRLLISVIILRSKMIVWLELIHSRIMHILVLRILTTRKITS